MTIECEVVRKKPGKCKLYRADVKNNVLDASVSWSYFENSIRFTYVIFQSSAKDWVNLSVASRERMWNAACSKVSN